MKKFTLIFMLLALVLLVPLTSCETVDKLMDRIEIGRSGDSAQEDHVHLYGKWVTVKEATCETNGQKMRVCACGDTEVEDVSKLSHEYVNGVCKMCNQSEQDQFVPDYKTGQANTIGKDSVDSSYTAQGDYLYFSSKANTIDKIKKDGTGYKTVYNVTSGTIRNINVIGDWIYFTCGGKTLEKSYIARVRTDGSRFEKIISSVNALDMLVVKDTIYYTSTPFDGTYKDYAKEVMPLYTVSVNGGTPMQIHDGAVRNMVADSTYIYFVCDDGNGKDNIDRIKHGSTSSSRLYTDKRIRGLSLEDSRLYFVLLPNIADVTLESHSLASVSTTGGGYTVHGKIMQYGDTLHVIGNKAYYMGAWYPGYENPESIGFLEYSLSTKKQKLLMEETDILDISQAGDLLIFETYSNRKVTSLTIYNPKSNTFSKVKLS